MIEGCREKRCSLADPSLGDDRRLRPRKGISRNIFAGFAARSRAWNPRDVAYGFVESRERRREWQRKGGKGEQRLRASREEGKKTKETIETKKEIDHRPWSTPMSEHEREIQRDRTRQRRGRPPPLASASFRAPAAASLSSRRRASWEAGRGSISDTPDRSLCRRALVSSPSPCSRRSRPEIISTVLYRSASLFSLFLSVSRERDDSTSSLGNRCFLAESPRPIVRRNGIHFWPSNYRPPWQLILWFATLLVFYLGRRGWKTSNARKGKDRCGTMRNTISPLRGEFPETDFSPRKLFNVIYGRISLEQRSQINRWFRCKYSWIISLEG